MTALFLAPACPATAATFTPLYTLQGGDDGAFPTGVPLPYGGLIYGATQAGGGNQCAGAGCGTVYVVDPAHGTETVLHRFDNGSADKTMGQAPSGSLFVQSGSLFGAVQAGGTKPGGRGAVFSMDPATGQETLAYSFSQQEIGTHGLVQGGFSAKQPVLYGTSLLGPSNAGFIYTLDTSSGAVAIIYQFAKDNEPNSPVTVTGNLLYGTTQTAIYRLKLSTASLRTLHVFTHITDGYAPKGNLLLFQNKLYGVNFAGGNQHCAAHDDYACGTIFAYDLATQALGVAHAFNGADGAQPGAGLTQVNGLLYGTTNSGGDNNTGTIFSFDPATGQEVVVYSLPADSVAQSVSGLSVAEGALYGTYGTTAGHATLFKFLP